MMALTARAFGGMRTSDVHAWDWEHVDLDGFATAEVYRPKTDGEDDADGVLERLVLPELLRPPLHAWWTRWGRPSSGPVFPVMRGKRAGERQSKRSHVREFRRALWLAGVHRPLAGFDEALGALRRAEAAVDAAKADGRRAWWAARRERGEAEERAKALHAMQTDTKRTRAVDFHSLRRAYATALAAAGVNVQQAMVLAGHRDPRTHARYVELAQTGALATPPDALPDAPLVERLTAYAAQMDLGDPLGRMPANGPSMFLSDPSETRTRVTGVRGEPERSADDASGTKQAVSAKRDASRHALKRTECQNARTEPPGALWDAELADVVLQVALRGLAFRAALAVRTGLVD